MKRSALLALVLLLLVPAAAPAGQLLEGAVQVPALTVAADGGASLVSIDADDDLDRSPELVLRRAGPSGAFDRGTLLAQSAWLPYAGFAASGDGLVLTDEGGIRVRRFFADGTVGPAVPLSRPGWRASPLALDVAPSGAALAVWEELRGRRPMRLMAAMRPAGAEGFGAPQRLFADARSPVGLEAAAVGDRGDAVVAAGEEDCAGLHVMLARPGGGFGRAQRLGRGTCLAEAEMGADGTVVLAHTRVRGRPGAARYGLAVRRAAPGMARLSRARVLARRGLGSPIDIAMSPSGRIVLATGREVTYRRTDVEVWDAAPGAPLRRTGIVGRNLASEEVAADVDDEGRAIVAWGQDAPRPGTVVAYTLAMAARRSAAGAPFSQPEPLHEHSFQFMDVFGAALVPGGGAYVAWSAFSESDLYPPDGIRGAGVTRLPR
ncbi:MAG TPA: hypothetical protein VF529_19095 [Solirubrobacteraceae bacterium]